MTSVRHKILLVALLSVIASVGAFAAVMIYNLRITTQLEEQDQLQRAVSAYNELMWLRQRGCEAILEAVAWRPDVRQAMRDKDRAKLLELLKPTFAVLKQSFAIAQLSVYDAEGEPLLRVDVPDARDGSYAAHRQMVMDALDRRQTMSGIELDRERMSHRTVTPVMDGKTCVGLLELGINYDEAILRDFRTRRDADSRIWLSFDAAGSAGLSPDPANPPAPIPQLFLYVSTFGARRTLPAHDYVEVMQARAPVFGATDDNSGTYSTTAVPIIGYRAALLGILEISHSRAHADAVFQRGLIQTIGVASLVALGAMVLIGATLSWVVLRPLMKLTVAARRQYEGHLAARVDYSSSDEFGLLADTFNSLSNRLTQTLQEQTQTIDQLRVARTAAEQANAAKDEFLAALSHELRTPLTPVLLAAEDLEKHPHLPEELKEYVRGMRRNVLLEARLIDDLLDLTRIARGKLELHLSPCDAHVLMAAAIEVCQGDIQARQLKVATNFSAERQWALADASRVQQVFWNLVKNAVKFTAHGGSITISTANEQFDGRDCIVLTVTDSGIGMSQNTLGRIFHLFEQGSRSITRRYGGLGLGLAISRRIVELHHGQITADSPGPGQGSTFTVMLPTTPAPATPPAPRGRKPAATGSVRILLVEDHPATANAMQRLLRDFGHSVHVVGSIAEALDAAIHQTFDLVISDLGLPDGSGTDLMAILHDKHGLAGIAVSGYGMQDDIARSTGSGFTAHLTKPITSEQLQNTIAEVMGQQMSARESL